MGWGATGEEVRPEPGAGSPLSWVLGILVYTPLGLLAYLLRIGAGGGSVGCLPLFALFVPIPSCIPSKDMGEKPPKRDMILKYGLLNQGGSQTVLVAVDNTIGGPEGVFHVFSVRVLDQISSEKIEGRSLTYFRLIGNGLRGDFFAVHILSVFESF